MLNTAERLAGILGGQVMGPDRTTLNKEHVRSIYQILNAKV
jgi:FtsZ-interacting cell division protein ZipA